MSELAINALVRLRAQIAGEIEHHQQAEDKAQRALAHVEGVLRIMAPEVELPAVTPKAFPPRKQGRRGENARLICVILRDTPKAMTVGEIADAFLERRGQSGAPPQERNRVMRCIENTLGRMRDRAGTAHAIPQHDGPQAWRLAD